MKKTINLDEFLGYLTPYGNNIKRSDAEFLRDSYKNILYSGINYITFIDGYNNPRCYANVID